MERARSISKSMVSYLRRAREHKEFLLRETKEFERGKRHLANIMGIESQEMTQADIDGAIKYLFPSGLFDKKARPMMKHPDLLYKAQKDAQFNEEGRPHHYLFYTTLPNYYEKLSELTQLLRDLNKYEDKQLANGVLDPPEDARYNLTGKTWKPIEQVCDMLLEAINEIDYDYLIRSLEHLLKHPYSMRAKPFIDQFARDLPAQSSDLNLPELIRDEATGQVYTVLVERSKASRVQVKTILNGSGKVQIEDQDCDKDILYFEHPYVRAMIYHPLRIANMQDKVDIYAKVVEVPKHLGDTQVARAIRYAVARSIAAYVDPEIRERLRLAGLLTEDLRVRERKKFGQMKARRKYTWKKR